MLGKDGPGLRAHPNFFQRAPLKIVLQGHFMNLRHCQFRRQGVALVAVPRFVALKKSKGGNLTGLKSFHQRTEKATHSTSLLGGLCTDSFGKHFLALLNMALVQLRREYGTRCAVNFSYIDVPAGVFRGRQLGSFFRLLLGGPRCTSSEEPV